MTTLTNKLLNVPTGDAEDARRRKLLNIILLGVAALTLLALLGSTIAVFAGYGGRQDEVLPLFMGLFVMIIGLGIIFAINRYGSGWFASSLFLLLLILVFSMSDSAQEIVNGRSLFLFVIPIIMASVLVRPYASFITALISSLIIVIMAFGVIGAAPNITAIAGFLTLALVSWLSARSLEQALSDLRVINKELDQRVSDRTHDLQEALARVQAESSKNQAILESIADGVIVFDREGKAMVANPSLTMLISQPVDQIIGHDVKTLMSTNVNEIDQQTVLRYIQNGNGSKESEDLSNIKFRWGARTLSLSFAPVKDNLGGSLGNVVVFRDFTREAELDQMKSAFVSMASHELRTPLNAILGYSDMLKEAVYGPLQDEQMTIMDRIIANTKRMLNLVNNLLDQAQIEAGKLTLKTGPFAVKDLLNELSSIMSVLAEQKGITFKCEIAPDVPSMLVSDSQRLHQILVNLVGNAIKFTDKGGVTVKAYCPDKTHWTLAVADTGRGIPPDAQTYIFEPFRQVDDPMTRKHIGSGLGLSIVKQLTNLLNGDILLVSEVDKGSTFTVTMPIVKVEEYIHDER
jgi:PAS domain S-box-containing protein